MCIRDSASSVAKLAVQVLDGTSVDYSKYGEVFAEDAAFQKGFKKGALIGLTYRAVLMIAVFLLPLHTLFLVVACKIRNCIYHYFFLMVPSP